MSSTEDASGAPRRDRPLRDATGDAGIILEVEERAAHRRLEVLMSRSIPCVLPMLLLAGVVGCVNAVEPTGPGFHSRSSHPGQQALTNAGNDANDCSSALNDLGQVLSNGNGAADDGLATAAAALDQASTDLEQAASEGACSCDTSALTSAIAAGDASLQPILDGCNAADATALAAAANASPDACEAIAHQLAAMSAELAAMQQAAAGSTPPATGNDGGEGEGEGEGEGAAAGEGEGAAAGEGEGEGQDGYGGCNGGNNGANGGAGGDGSACEQAYSDADSTIAALGSQLQQQCMSDPSGCMTATDAYQTAVDNALSAAAAACGGTGSTGSTG